MSCIRKEPCPKCGSRDNLARYEDGGAHCFSIGCGYYEKTGTDMEGKTPISKTKDMKLPELGVFKALPNWKISEDTCRKMRYSMGTYSMRDPETELWYDVKAHIVNVPNQSGQTVSSKIRMANKEFRYVGDTKQSGLVFQDVWPAGSGRKLVITEGEKDALAVCEIQERKYPVVSLPNGVESAVEVCGRSMEYLNSFEEVILMFDNDEAGQKCAEAVSRLLPTKMKIAKMEEKDAADMLKVGNRKGVINAIWNAQEWSPAGVVKLSSLREEMKKQAVLGKPWIYNQLTAATYGRREGELYFIGAGAGIGKTDFCLQQIVADMMNGEASAMFLLEQQVAETGKRLVGKFAGKLYHIPAAEGGYTDDELDADVDALLELSDPHLYDHFGAKDWDSIEPTIRYLASMGVKHFWVDHITALVADEADEQVAIKTMCAAMSGLCQELSINMYVVSHLATPQGTPHEEGGRVMMRHYRGSRAIGFWGHFIFALERNAQHEDKFARTVTTFRIIKDRYTGQSTGDTFLLGYDKNKGLQYELDNEECERYTGLMSTTPDAKSGNKFSEDF